MLTADTVERGALLEGALIEHSTPYEGRLRVAMITDGPTTGEGQKSCPQCGSEIR